MRAPIRLLLLAAVPIAALCACVLLSADRSGVRRTALSSWLHEVQRGEHLRAAGSNLMRSNETVHDIILALAEQRLTLPEAAERIRSERESRVYPFRLKPNLHPGESLDDHYLRFTVELVAGHLEGQECQGEVVQRLQRELHTCLAKSSEYSTTEADSNDESAE